MKVLQMTRVTREVESGSGRTSGIARSGPLVWEVSWVILSSIPFILGWLVRAEPKSPQTPRIAEGAHRRLMSVSRLREKAALKTENF